MDNSVLNSIIVKYFWCSLANCVNRTSALDIIHRQGYFYYNQFSQGYFRWYWNLTMAAATITAIATIATILFSCFAVDARSAIICAYLSRSRRLLCFCPPCCRRTFPNRFNSILCFSQNINILFFMFLIVTYSSRWLRDHRCWLRC